MGLRVNPNGAAQHQKSAAPAMYGAAPQGLNAASICRRHHRLQLFDHAKLDKDTRLLGRDRNVEHPGEGIPLQMRQPPGAVRLIRLHQARTRRRSAALRIAFDQGHEALRKQALVLGTQPPARRRVVLHARAQAPVEQDVAGIKSSAAHQTKLLLQRNVCMRPANPS